MSSITLKRLLGTENVGGSRSVINSNSEITENSINLIKGYIDTDIAGGKLTIGDVAIPIGANAVSDVLFSLAASGTVTGNFSVGGNLDVTSATTWTGVSLFKNSVTLDGSGASGNAAFQLGLNGAVAIEHLDGKFAEPQLATTAVQVPNALSFNAAAPTRALLLDYTSWGATGAQSTIILPNGTTIGQKLFIRASIVDATLVGADNSHGIIIDGLFTNDWLTYSIGGTKPLHIKGATVEDIQRQWISLYWTAGGWSVENAHPEIFNLV